MVKDIQLYMEIHTQHISLISFEVPSLCVVVEQLEHEPHIQKILRWDIFGPDHKPTIIRRIHDNLFNIYICRCLLFNIYLYKGLLFGKCLFKGLLCTICLYKGLLFIIYLYRGLLFGVCLFRGPFVLLFLFKSVKVCLPILF